MKFDEVVKAYNEQDILKQVLTEMNRNIESLTKQKQKVAEQLNYAKLVTHVIDGVPIQRREILGYDGIDMSTIGAYDGNRWGRTYKTYDNRGWGVYVNGISRGNGYTSASDQLYCGGNLLGFFDSREEAEAVLTNWVVKGETS